MKITAVMSALVFMTAGFALAQDDYMSGGSAPAYAPWLTESSEPEPMEGAAPEPVFEEVETTPAIETSSPAATAPKPAAKAPREENDAMDQAIQKAASKYAEAESHNDIGKALMPTNVKRAIEEFTQAIRIVPTVAEFYVNRGNAYAQKKDFNRAVADYEAALKLEPHNDHIITRLERAQQRTKGGKKKKK